MADRPTESIKISCAHCGETFFVTTKERSTAVCPKCKEPINAPHSGIVKRKERKKSISGILPPPVKSLASSTLIGAPVGLEAELKRGDEKSNPKAFKEALAMSRMEIDLELEPTFFDPPDPFEFDADEPTVAISLKSDVNDQTKPPPGVIAFPKTQNKTLPKPFESNLEPITVPIIASSIAPSEPMTMQSLPHASDSEVAAEPKKFRRGMKTSQLSDLLKKAKKEKKANQTNQALPKIVKPPKIPAKAPIGAVSLHRSPTKPVIKVPKSIKAKKAKPSEDSLLIQLQALDKNHVPKPGFASENQGSGFIKLPTTDILDVLGKGQYRLRVQDIIYEPVDEKGLTQLIKGGVLLGAEDIAEAHGDWMPISEHPVFSGLRKRMAKEAHSLLSKVASGKPEKKPTEKKPADTTPIEKKPSDFVAMEKTKRVEPLSAEELKTNDKKTAPILAPMLTNPESEPAASAPKHTMQMFAMSREDPPPTLPVASSEETLEAPEKIEPPALVKEADQTIEKIYEDTSSGVSVDIAPELTESEFSADEEPKKKSASGIFLFVVLFVGILMAGVLYANYEGWLDPLISPETKNDPVAETPTKDKKKEIEKEDDTKIVDVVPDKKKDDKEIVVVEDPEKKKDDKEVIAVLDPKKDDTKENDPEKVEDAIEVTSFTGAKFLNKASGKSLAMIFEKEGSSFLLIPETEKGGLKRIIAAEKLCELLACPFANNKIKEVTINAAEFKESGAPSAKIIVTDGKMNALIQPISPSTFSIAATTAWRPILRASKSARALDLPKSTTGKDLTLSNNDFARQLGGILLRDFLINDWNRFESKPSHIGIRNGKLVDQASNVAFEARASGRVKGRFGWSSVYPAEMVEKLKNLERESTLELLFPNASTTDKSRFSVFWKQRSNALERIKTLAAKSGKENVLLIK